MNKILVLILLTLVNTICLAEQNTPTISNCDFLEIAGDVSRFSCGILQVPENHDKPNGRQISIAYVVLKSENSITKEFPLIYFTGGPGGQALTNVQRLLANPILKTRDIIYFDQRGIGKSSPLPDITTELYGLFSENLTIADERKLIATLVQELRQTCDDQGIEIEMYNSFQNARDVGMLMDHLGYEKYNLRGGSYGTRLARFVVDYFPEKINSAIYESPAPYRNDYLTSRMEDYNGALRKVFNYCKQDKQCSTAYPDLEATYHNVLKRFAKEPLELKSNNTPFFLNVQDAIFLVRTLLYTSNSRQFVPRFIKALDNSNYSLIQQIVRGSTRSNSNMAMFLVAENYEEYDPKVTAEVLASKYEKLDLLPYELPLFGSLYLGSANFLKSKAPEQMKEYKVSKVPSLIFINQYDPVTPPINASIFKSKMTNAHAFILDAGGHGGGDVGCKRSIMDVFMSSPSASLDTGCLKLFKQ